jgi:hypothetical protein
MEDSKEYKIEQILLFLEAVVKNYEDKFNNKVIS